MHGILYKYHFLINEMQDGKPKTFVASSQRLPGVGDTVTVYIREINDYCTVGYNAVLAVLKPKPLL